MMEEMLDKLSRIKTWRDADNSFGTAPMNFGDLHQLRIGGGVARAFEGMSTTHHQHR
jgi:hypothetical protein